jgi:hypothetical protein
MLHWRRNNEPRPEQTRVCENVGLRSPKDMEQMNLARVGGLLLGTVLRWLEPGKSRGHNARRGEMGLA